MLFEKVHFLFIINNMYKDLLFFNISKSISA